MNYFTEGHEDLHNEEEQMLRQDRSSELEINWEPAVDENGDPIINPKSKMPRRHYFFDGRKQTCQIGNYLVTLEHCDCMDFAQRRKPCKHMYKLASRSGVFSWQDKMTQDLLADFSKGYADGWRFVVRPCNFEGLNIKRQSINGKTKLTQGTLYNFQRGSAFYDTLAAYEGTWGETLKKLGMCLQIDSSTPSYAESLVEYDGKRYVRKNQPMYGFVEFSVYTPNAERTRVEKVRDYSCRQDEFVTLLKTGSFADVNGELIELLR